MVSRRRRRRRAATAPLLARSLSHCLVLSHSLSAAGTIDEPLEGVAYVDQHDLRVNTSPEKELRLSNRDGGVGGWRK